MPWYRELLEQTLGDSERNLQAINIKNCIGTVLAINGPRKYYCMYHAWHKKRLEGDGKFMGFESSDESDSNSCDSDVERSKKLFQADLLVGLAHWMDRLCEGNLRRLRVQYWPLMN